LEFGQRHLGLTIIAELDSNRVWECARDGQPRWQVQNLQGPIDAQALPGGRVLIAEHQGQRVTERDLKGEIVWEKRVNGNPIACQRLPNGNTFIATYQGVLEVTRDGRELYTYNPTAALGLPLLYGAQKLRNGHIVCISGQGMMLEMDSAGRHLKKIQLTNNGGWCSIEGLPGGRFLVALTNHGRVLEIDAEGKTLWQCSVPGASHATRLPNGHTLVASMLNRRVVEVDAAGKTVWEQSTNGRPFHIHRR
jgi:outer membrane protein assembly factor BamB